MLDTIDALYALLVDETPPPTPRAGTPRVDLSLETTNWSQQAEEPSWRHLRQAEEDWQRRLLEQDTHQTAPRRAWRRVGPQTALVVAFQDVEPGTEFTSRELQVLSALEPHVERASVLRQRQRIGKRALDALSEAMLLVDAAGRVLQMNEAARALLSDPTSGLGLEDGVLFADDPECDCQLHELIEAVAKFPADGCPSPAIASKCTTQQHPYRIRVESTGREGWLPEVGAQGGCTVFIADPNRELVDVERWLRSAYELTPKEVAVAVQLAGGNTVEETAATLGVLPSTVKTHLKNIFRKMNVGRQSELVRAIALGCGGTRGT